MKRMRSTAAIPEVPLFAGTTEKLRVPKKFSLKHGRQTIVFGYWKQSRLDLHTLLQKKGEA
jgi:hypothetical protein